MNQAVEKLQAPPAVRDALARLCTGLQQAAGPNLHGLVLFGSLARGRYTPGRSDVNVVVVLEDAAVEKLAPLAPVLRAAFRAARVEPMVITAGEVRGAADVFPTKFLDIQAHHVVLLGHSPFAGLAVDREHLRLRVEQELRNLALRLRRRFITLHDEPASLPGALEDVRGALAVELRSLLVLAGKPAPADDSPEAVFAAAAQGLALPGLALPHDEARFSQVLAAIARAADVASELK